MTIRGETFRSIGKRLGVHHSTIVRLVNGQHWKQFSHVNHPAELCTSRIMGEERGESG